MDFVTGESALTVAVLQQTKKERSKRCDFNSICSLQLTKWPKANLMGEERRKKNKKRRKRSGKLRGKKTRVLIHLLLKSTSNCVQYYFTVYKILSYDTIKMSFANL